MNNVLRMHRGSALVESTVLLTVLLPMVFGVAMIGKLIDLRQSTEVAGRYAAWEATVHGVDSEHETQPGFIKERFFGEPDQYLSSVPSEAGINPLWGSPENSLSESDEAGLASVVSIDDNSVETYTYQRGVGDSTVAMSVGSQLGRTGEILDGLSGNSWGLTTNGLLRAGVAVSVQSNAWLTSDVSSTGNEDSATGDAAAAKNAQAGVATPTNSGCNGTAGFGCVQSSSVILVDGWSAGSDDQARRRVRSLMPASALQPLGDLLSNVGVIPMFKELKQLDGAFGHVDMDALPEYAK